MHSNAPVAAVLHPQLASATSAKAAVTAAATAGHAEVCFERDAEKHVLADDFGLGRGRDALATSENCLEMCTLEQMNVTPARVPH